jgi:hypothetical protein
MILKFDTLETWTISIREGVITQKASLDSKAHFFSQHTATYCLDIHGGRRIDQRFNAFHGQMCLGFFCVADCLNISKKESTNMLLLRVWNMSRRSKNMRTSPV